MKRIILILTLCVGCITAADAQSSFIQRIQKSNAGEGKVTITQSKDIDELVNGKAQPQQQQEAGKKTANEQRQQPQPPTSNSQAAQNRQASNTARRDSTDTNTDTEAPEIDTRKKVMMRSYKVNGYRVQAYAGGNQRKDRVKAEQVGTTIKASYPEEPIYVHFYSPRWICRVGNYRTYEEAHQMLVNIRRLGFRSASIVKGKITVQY